MTLETDTVAELFPQVHIGASKTAVRDLHLRVIEKGYGFDLKGMNIFPRAWF